MSSFSLIAIFWLLWKVPAISSERTFYLITNTAQIFDHQEDVYLYAISKNGMCEGEEVEFIKKEGLPLKNVQSGVIQSDNREWGCYLKLGATSRYKRARVGNYEASFKTMDGPTVTRNTFIRPRTRELNTNGFYTVTVYPDVSGVERLAPSRHNTIGVAWSPGCHAIKWCKGRKRNINTGPRLTLSSTRDAGIYTIFRPSRGKRGWFVQIKVIVASCQEDQYLSGGICIVRTVTECEPGGQLKDAADECLYPPYFTDYTCATEFCPDGWFAVEGVDYRCYRPFDTRMTYASSENLCQSQDGHLASIHSQDELDKISNAIHASGVDLSFNWWIGLNDRETEGNFIYTDNSKFDFSKWESGHPTNVDGSEDCVQLSVFSNTLFTFPCFFTPYGLCMQVPCSSFVLGQEAGATLRCADLPGGNPTCRGFLVCMGDLYGCKCASGWYGNRCDRPCPAGKWGPGCELFCPRTDKKCDRFVGPSSTVA